MAGNVKYETEEERREAELSSKRKYASKKILCEHCDKYLSQGHRSRHSKMCLARLVNKNN